LNAFADSVIAIVSSRAERAFAASVAGLLDPPITARMTRRRHDSENLLPAIAPAITAPDVTAMGFPMLRMPADCPM
jgi:hypothetical protein